MRIKLNMKNLSLSKSLRLMKRKMSNLDGIKILMIIHTIAYVHLVRQLTGQASKYSIVMGEELIAICF